MRPLIIIAGIVVGIAIAGTAALLVAGPIDTGIKTAAGDHVFVEDFEFVVIGHSLDPLRRFFHLAAPGISDQPTLIGTIKAEIPNAEATVKNYTGDQNAAFRFVMAMQPAGPDSFVFCGEVNYLQRNGADSGFIRFLTVGHTVVLAPYGSYTEATYARYCDNAKPIAPVIFD